jgi:[acyl-carrier-protein] S-malonyltransferase
MRPASAAQLSRLHDGAVAFLFPGQGSQHPGMLRALDRCTPGSRALLARAERCTGIPLGALMADGTADALAHPRVAQLSVFVTSSVLHEDLVLRGRRPTVVAGHSLGEYSALAAAGVVDWEDALRLVDARGSAMAAAAADRPGSMAAVVGLSQERLEDLCRSATRAAEHVTVANVNSASQLVVSGTDAAVAEVADAARGAGALRVSRLPVGGAYHSVLMQPAAEAMCRVLRDVPMRRPSIPLVSSVTGRLVDDPEDCRAVLMRQVLMPVQWRRTVEQLLALDVEHFVEVGPGRVLSGLCRENARGVNRVHADDLLALPQATPALTGVGRGV